MIRKTAGVFVGIPAGFGAALALVFIASFIAAEGWPDLPPSQRWHWLPLLAGAAAAVGAVASWRPKSFVVLAACSILVGGLSGLMIIMPGVDTIAWRLGLGVAVSTLAILLGWLAQKSKGVALPLGLAAVFAAMSLLFMASHFSKMAILAGGAGAMHGGAALVGLSGARCSIGAAGATVAAALIPSLALTGYSYDYGIVNPINWALVAASPVVIWPIVLARISREA